MDNRNLILNNIFSNGKLKHYTLKKYWYEKNIHSIDFSENEHLLKPMKQFL